MMVTLLLMLLSWSGPAGADGFVIVTAPETPIASLSSFQLKQIYLGKLDRMGGIRIKPIQLKSKHPLRTLFDNQVLGNPDDVAEYWLQQKLLGGARQPMTVGDWPLAYAYVRRNPGFICYAPADRAEELESKGLKLIPITP